MKYFKFHKWICELKYFIQRGRRGYSDFDVYNLDNYLSGWLPAALEKIKKFGGTPGCRSIYKNMEPDTSGQYTKEQEEIAKENWKSIVQKMIDGFTAHQRLCYASYPEEDLKKSMEKDNKIFMQGMRLFVKYYWDLWI